MRVVFAISSAATLEPTYTTVYIAWALLERGHQVRFVEPWDFEVDGRRRVVARAHAFDESPGSRETLVDTLRRRAAPRRYVELGASDVLLLRMNPLDQAVLVFAQMAARAGAVVHNDPSTLLLTAHKGYLASLPGVPSPRTLVTRSRATAALFAAEIPQGVAVKPARSSGGKGVVFVSSPRRDGAMEAAFDEARRFGDAYVVVQAYLPRADRGEKRLLWLDGSLIGGYLRQRAPGDFRHNLGQGAAPQPCVMGNEDRRLVECINPHLLRDGVWLAGLDVIDDHLVEVNVLNPGGIYWGDTLNGTGMVDRVVQKLEEENAMRVSPTRVVGQ